MPGTMTASDPSRVKLIRAVHARARDMGMDDDTRRALQVRAAGKDSCRDMSAAELRRVLALMRGGRGNGGRRPRDRMPDGPLAAKLRALWWSGIQLGVVERPGDGALMSFIKRQTGLDAARFAHDPRDANKAVEGLKAWLAREAGVDWSPYPGVSEPADNPCARVLEAQWRILAGLGDSMAIGASLDTWVRGARGDNKNYVFLEPAQANALIRRLGWRVRQAKAIAGNG